MELKKRKEHILVIGRGGPPANRACNTFNSEEIECCRAITEAGGRPVLVADISSDKIKNNVLNISIYSHPFFQTHLDAVISNEEIDAVYAPFVDSEGWKVVQKLRHIGYWKKRQVKIIRTNLPSGYEKNRFQKLHSAVSKLHLEQPCFDSISSTAEAHNVLKTLGGFPVLMRAEGWKTAKITNFRDFNFRVSRYLEQIPPGELYLVECLSSWKEVTIGVLKDRRGSSAVVNTSEHVVPAGTLSCGPVTASPIQTLWKDERELLHRHALNLVQELGDFSGFCSITFALGSGKEHVKEHIIVSDVSFSTEHSAAISLNMETSLINVTTKLALGYPLDNLEFARTHYNKKKSRVLLWAPVNDRTGGTKVENNAAQRSSAKEETVYIGHNFCEVLQKLWQDKNFMFAGGDTVPTDQETAGSCLTEPYWDQLINIYQAFSIGVSVKEIRKATSIDSWVIVHIKLIADLEQQLQLQTLSTIPKLLWGKLKKYGFTDTRIADILSLTKDGVTEMDVLEKREKYGVTSSISTFSSASSMKFDRDKTIVIVAGAASVPGKLSLKSPALLLANEARRLGYRIVLITADIKLAPFWISFADRLYIEPLAWDALYEVYKREDPTGIFIEGNYSEHKALKKRFQELKTPIVQIPASLTFPDS